MAQQRRLVEAEPRLTVLSFGAGQDSTALAYLLAHDEAFRRKYAPRDLVVVFSDTGDELPETYRHVERMRAWFMQQGWPFVVIPPGEGVFRVASWPSLLEASHRNGTVASVYGVRSCSKSLKFDPIYKWLSSHVQEAYGVGGKGKRALLRFASRHGRVRVLIGFAAEEDARVTRSLAPAREAWMRLSVEKRFPLHEQGLTRQACQDAITRLGYEVPFASACKTCFYASPLHLAFLARFHPDVVEDWHAREAAKLAKFRHLGVKNKGVFSRGTVKENVDRAVAQYVHLSDVELYELKRRAGHAVKSSF